MFVSAKTIEVVKNKSEKEQKCIWDISALYSGQTKV